MQKLNCLLQIDIVEVVCIRYLLDHCHLTGRQLARQQCQLTAFGKPDARKLALQKLVAMPWLEDVYKWLVVIFTELLANNYGLCHTLLSLPKGTYVPVTGIHVTCSLLLIPTRVGADLSGWLLPSIVSTNSVVLMALQGMLSPRCYPLATHEFGMLQGGLQRHHVLEASLP